MRVGRRRVPREEAAVEDTRCDHRDAPFHAERQQFVEGALLEQCVPACQHEGVHVGVAGELGQHRGLVHAGTDSGDDTLSPQLFERRIPVPERSFPVVVRVVEIDEIDAVEAEPLETGFERAKDAVAAEIPHARVRRGHVEALVVVRR